jgi:iron complex outermembrane recepter protein
MKAIAGKSAGQVLKVAIAAVLAAPAAAPPAVAAEQTSITLEEIVVTAQRREQGVIDVPYNISAVSGASLERTLTIDSADLMRTVASASVVDRGFRNQGVINGIIIRGLNVDGSALGDYAVGTVPTVSTYVNETPIYANFLLRDLERVEVLRGPQGTLYGSGSLGGTVRYIMRDPWTGAFDARLQGSVSQSEGSDGTNWTLDGMLNVPLGETLALRLNASRLDQAGIVDYVNVYQLDGNGVPAAPSGILSTDASYRRVKDADTVEINYVRAAMLWLPTDGFRALLAYQHQDDEVGGRRQQTVGNNGAGAPYRDLEIGSIQLEPSSRDVDLASLEIDVDFGFATLTSSTSWYDHQGDSVSENTGFYAQNDWLSDFYYNYPRPMASAVRSYGDRAVVQELRLVSVDSEASRASWVAGAYYIDRDGSSSQESYLRGFKAWWDAADLFGDNDDWVSGDQDFDYQISENYTELALFGELTWQLSSAVALTVGARWFDSEIENSSVMSLPLWAGLFPTSEASSRSTDDDVLLKGNLAWRFREGYLAYATVSEGYRRGGSNAVPTSGFFAENSAWLGYGADSVVNYEVGVKGATSTLQFSAAAFFIDWKDVQINTSTPIWGFFAVQNGGKARNVGVELELTQVLTDRLRYTIGYSYVDAELREDIYSPSNPATPTALRGQQLPGTPQNTVSLSLDYDQPLANGWTWISNFQAYYQSETENAIQLSERFSATLDSFALLNLTTGLDFGRWQARLFVRNLTNEEGTTGLFTEEYMGTSPSQNYFGNGSKRFLALPRTVGVSFTVDF